MDEIELHNQSRSIFIPAWRSIVLDTNEDWEIAEQVKKFLDNVCKVEMVILQSMKGGFVFFVIGIDRCNDVT